MKAFRGKKTVPKDLKRPLYSNALPKQKSLVLTMAESMFANTRTQTAIRQPQCSLPVEAVLIEEKVLKREEEISFVVMVLYDAFFGYYYFLEGIRDVIQ